MRAPEEASLHALLDAKRFALVGAGQLGELTLDLWPETKTRPEFALDSHRRGLLREVEIRDLKDHRPDPGVVYLLSAFKMPVADARSVWASLKQPNLLTVYDFFESHCPQTLSNGWRRLDATQEDRDRITRARRCFTEPESRLAFDAVVAWRYRRNLVDDYPVGPESDKYNLAQFGRAGCFYDYVYDCGSYDLALPSSLAKAGVTFARLTAFEPDPRRHTICRENAVALKSGNPLVEIEVEACAICDRDESAPFIASGLFSARLATQKAPLANQIMIETFALDTYHEMRHGWSDDELGPRVLIKAHVESAEPRLLAGASRLIERTRADVFVNLSHDETSFLEIPCLLDSYGCFDLFLRSSSLFGEGLTLFARRRS